MLGDHATLTALGGGAFSLREASGVLRVFAADGTLNYVEDTNGNRIGVLMRLRGQWPSWAIAEAMSNVVKMKPPTA